MAVTLEYIYLFYLFWLLVLKEINVGISTQPPQNIFTTIKSDNVIEPKINENRIVLMIILKMIYNILSFVSYRLSN